MVLGAVLFLLMRSAYLSRLRAHRADEAAREQPAPEATAVGED
jgi:hypothetical protein